MQKQCGIFFLYFFLYLFKDILKHIFIAVSSGGGRGSSYPLENILFFA